MENVGAVLELDAEARTSTELIGRLEAARLATSFLFEADVDADPSCARERYLFWYREFVEVEDPALWALDTFRTADPFHVHTFLVGREVAAATIAFLSDRYGRRHTHWGEWLRGHFYRSGRSRTLWEKLEDLGRHCPERIRALRAG